jgi:Uma2 family endonuclease
VASQPGRIVLTYEDLLDTPDDGKRYEILEGDLYVTAAPNLAHQHCVGMLLQIIGPHVRERGLGRIYVAPADVLLSNISVVEPDLVFISRQRLDLLTPANVRGTPDLAIEVLSPSTERTDRGRKMQIYGQYGLEHYWLVDPAARFVEAYRLVEGRYELAARARDDEPLCAPPFPELTIPLAELWS